MRCRSLCVGRDLAGQIAGLPPSLKRQLLLAFGQCRKVSQPPLPSPSFPVLLPNSSACGVVPSSQGQLLPGPSSRSSSAGPFSCPRPLQDSYKKNWYKRDPYKKNWYKQDPYTLLTLLWSPHADPLSCCCGSAHSKGQRPLCWTPGPLQDSYGVMMGRLPVTSQLGRAQCNPLLPWSPLSPFLAKVDVPTMNDVHFPVPRGIHFPYAWGIPLSPFIVRSPLGLLSVTQTCDSNLCVYCVPPGLLLSPCVPYPEWWPSH